MEKRFVANRNIAAKQKKGWVISLNSDAEVKKNFKGTSDVVIMERIGGEKNVGISDTDEKGVKAPQRKSKGQ